MGVLLAGEAAEAVPRAAIAPRTFAPMQNSQVILGGMKAARPRHNMKFPSYVSAKAYR
jgi:hypothetical protein